MRERLLRLLCCLGENDKLVKVKSWWPSLDYSPWGFEGIGWPVMLVDRWGHKRMTMVPIWNRAHLRVLFRCRGEVA